MWVKMRYVVAKPNRDGSTRWYWQRPGFPTRRLPDGEVERVKVAHQFNARADAEKRTEPVEPEHGTITWAIDKYRHSEDFTTLAFKSREAYQRWMLALAATVGDQLLTSLTRRAVKETLDGIESKGSRRHCAAVMRAIAEIGVDYEFLSANPVTRLRLPTSKPRQAVWLPEDQAAFLAACDGELHGNAIALGFKILLNTAQRPGDMRRMQWSQYDGQAIKLRQQKTGKLVEVPCHSEVRDALDTARLKANGTTIVARPDGRAFSELLWLKHFNAIKTKAGLEHLQARDLRRTAAVRLAEAGATVPEIAAVTGHSIDRTERIMEVYVPRTRAMAVTAIEKLERKR